MCDIRPAGMFVNTSDFSKASVKDSLGEKTNASLVSIKVSVKDVLELNISSSWVKDSLDKTTCWQCTQCTQCTYGCLG